MRSSDPSHDPLATAFVLVETRNTGELEWAVKWRGADATRLRRRLAAGAWMVRERGGRWRTREGRPPPGQLSAFQARGQGSLRLHLG